MTADYTAFEIAYFLRRDHGAVRPTEAAAMQYRALLDAAWGAEVAANRAGLGFTRATTGA